MAKKISKIFVLSDLGALSKDSAWANENVQRIIKTRTNQGSIDFQIEKDLAGNNIFRVKNVLTGHFRINSSRFLSGFFDVDPMGSTALSEMMKEFEAVSHRTIKDKSWFATYSHADNGTASGTLL